MIFIVDMLKGDTMSNLIDKQAAIDASKNADVCVSYTLTEPIDDIVEASIEATKRSVIASIETIEAVQSEPHWIQCSETVDIPDHEILACDKYGEVMFGYLAYEDNQWLCVSDDCMMYDPIAWSEKQEPYRGRR